MVIALESGVEKFPTNHISAGWFIVSTTLLDCMSVPAEKDTFSDSEGDGIRQCEMSKGNIGSPNSIGAAAGSGIVVELNGKCCLECSFFLPIASRAR